MNNSYFHVAFPAAVLITFATALHGSDVLRVGVARVEITPPLHYPMSGYYYSRGATGTLDSLEAKTLVLEQGETRVAICICDLIGIPSALTTEVRKRVAAQSDIPPRNVVLAATHTHTGPAFGRDLTQHLGVVTGDREDPASATDYPEELIAAITQSIVNALGDRAACALEIGRAQVDNVSFNRRFLLKDGTARTWASLADEDVVRAAGPIDPDLSVLLVRGADARLRAALAVFALHLDTTGGTQYSADFPNFIEEALRQDFGDDFTLVFGAGTCGDINHVDPTGAPRRKPQEIGEILAAALATSVPASDAVQPALAIASRVEWLPLQPATADQLEWARAIVMRDRQGEKLDFLTEVEAYKILSVAALREQQHASAAEDRSAPESTDSTLHVLPVDVHAIRLSSDAAIVTLPGEVFVQLGLEIKRRSPFTHTFVIELACSSDTKYIPTRAAYAQGSYEPTNSALAPGGGEQLVSVALDLLQKLHTPGER